MTRNPDPVADILKIIEGRRLWPGNPTARMDAARKVHSRQKGRRLFSAVSFEALVEHFTTYGLPGADPVAQAQTSLLSGEWLELVEDLKGETDPYARKWRDGDSDLEFATAENPYGWWVDPMAHMRPKQEARIHDVSHDHNKPGQWNPWRQSFNLSVSEMSRLGLPDCRRRGCSRFEVLGDKPGAVSKPRFDPREVEDARQPDHVPPHTNLAKQSPLTASTGKSRGPEPVDGTVSHLPDFCSPQSHRANRDIQRQRKETTP